MFFGPMEELSKARVADHERLVARLLLQREARAAVTDELQRYPQTNVRRLPWSHGWRPRRTAS